MNNKIKIIIIIAISVLVLAAIVLGIILGAKLLSKKCEPLTFLALKKFEIAGGAWPVEGDKCKISKNSYLLRLIYEDEESAEIAKTGLQLATSGTKDEIDGFDWITEYRNSSVFWTNDEKLGILIIPGQDDEKAVAKLLDKAFKKLK